MSNIKGMMFVLLVLGNNFIYAGTMGSECIPGSITTPCDQSGWVIGAQALYLQPSFGGQNLGYSAFSYGTDVAGNIVGSPAINYISNINSKWTWGFQIEGAYLFSRGQDIDVNWYHLNGSTAKYYPANTLFAGNAPNLYAGRFRLRPSWDAVNVEFGQRFDFHDNKQLRVHAGVEFARIRNKFINYPMLTSTGPALFVTTDHNSYQGFGPRLGADGTYHVWHGIGVYAKGAVGLLAGTSKQNVAGYPNLVFPNSFSTGNYVQTNHSVVVPELEGKLGLKYDCLMALGNLSVDVGYLWIDYFNSVISQTGSGLAGSAVSTSTAANFNLNGLYFGLKWISHA